MTPAHAAALAVLEGPDAVQAVVFARKELAALCRADVAMENHNHRYVELVNEHGATWWTHEMTVLMEARKAALAAVADKLTGEGK